MENYPLTPRIEAESDAEMNKQKTRPERYVIVSKKIDQTIKRRTLQPDRTGSKRKKVNRPRRGMLTKNCEQVMETNKKIINLRKKQIVVELGAGVGAGADDNGGKFIKQQEIKEKSKTNSRAKRGAIVDRKRCFARIASGEQCARNSSDDQEFCSCHRKHCPYGRIDGPLEGKFLNVPRKRGPKMRNNKEYKLDELDPMLYQQTQMVKINGGHYLIDQWGLLFRNDNSCEIVGRRLGNEIHWYI